jgi:hypothetical protein
MYHGPGAPGSDGEEKEMGGDPGLPVCVFLVPLVRDGDRQPHPPVLWRLLQDALVERFGGATGPETVAWYRDREPVSGAWSPGEGEAPVTDLSRRYTVALPPDRVDDLRDLLRRVGHSFDQQAMYLEVAGFAEMLEVRPEDGFLGD